MVSEGTVHGGTCAEGNCPQRHELPTANYQLPNEVRDEDDGLMAGIEVIRKNPKAPKFMKVLGDAMERSARSGKGGPVLTPEEAAFLASDPEFMEFDPEMACALSEAEARGASRCANG